MNSRLNSYHAQTSPLVDYYSKKGIHIAVNAALDASVVLENIHKAFAAARAKASFLQAEA